MTGRRLLTVVAALVVFVPSVAGADIVTFRGGRTMSAASVRVDADVVVIELRAGGEMRVPLDFVVDVAPDEVPYVAPATTSDSRVVAVMAVAEVDMAPAARGTDLVALVDTMAARHGVDRKLAQALVRVESNYQPRAVSPKGAMGLMQLMPATAERYAVTDPFDPTQNLSAGLQHLRGLLDRFGRGREALALAAYNAGEGAVSRYGGIPPYRETQNYVRRILSLTGR